MTAITQDTKTITSLTQENRTGVASLSQDNKTTSGGLWSATILPWALDYPWLWAGNGLGLTLDIRV